MYCPTCGRKYRNERICPTCHRVLVERPADADGQAPMVGAGAEVDHDALERDESGPVSECIFRTRDVGLLPLATMALDTADIHYVVHRGPEAALLGEAAGVELHVRSADADEARALLADLEHAGERGLGGFEPSAVPEPDPGDERATASESSGRGAIALIDADSGWPLAAVSEDQLEWLGQRLARDERRFYIDAATLDMLAADDADPALLDVLRTALGEREGVDLRPVSELLFDASTGRRLAVVFEDDLARLTALGLAAGVELTQGLLAKLEEAGADARLIEALGVAYEDGVERIAAVKPDRRPTPETLALVDSQTDRTVGVLTASQAEWLGDRLEPQPVVFGDPDYCIDADVLAYLEAEGADRDLLGLLRQALAGRDEMFVRW